MEPKRERFTFTKDITNVQNQQIKNWEVTITYPYTSDTENFLVKDGLFIVDKKTALIYVNTVSLYANVFKCFYEFFITELHMCIPLEVDELVKVVDWECIFVSELTK
jgi:hypothetical protein